LLHSSVTAGPQTHDPWIAKSDALPLSHRATPVNFTAKSQNPEKDDSIGSNNHFSDCSKSRSVVELKKWPYPGIDPGWVYSFTATATA